MSIAKKLLYTWSPNLSLLILRLGFGLFLFYKHGLYKMSNFDSLSDAFPSFMGIPGTLILAIFVLSEFFCSILTLLGLYTRIASLLIALTFSMTIFGFYEATPAINGELSYLYLIAFSTLFFSGPGKYSIDTKIS